MNKIFINNITGKELKISNVDQYFLKNEEDESSENAKNP